MRAMEDLTMVNHTCCIRFREKNDTDCYALVSTKAACTDPID